MLLRVSRAALSHCGRRVCSWCSSRPQTDSRRSSGTCCQRTSALHSAAGCTPSAALQDKTSVSPLHQRRTTTQPRSLPVCLTGCQAEVVEVVAAAVGDPTVGVAAAAGRGPVRRLGAAVPAGAHGFWKQQEPEVEPGSGISGLEAQGCRCSVGELQSPLPW